MKMLKVASLSAMMLFTSFDAVAEATNSNQLSDERVRHAIAYAIDMETIVETLMDGKAIAASSLIPNGPFKPDGLNMFKYNPDKARSLLKAANWDGDRELKMRYYYGDQLTSDLMVAIQITALQLLRGILLTAVMGLWLFRTIMVRITGKPILQEIL